MAPIKATKVTQQSTQAAATGIVRMYVQIGKNIILLFELKYSLAAEAIPAPRAMFEYWQRIQHKYTPVIAQVTIAPI